MKSLLQLNSSKQSKHSTFYSTLLVGFLLIATAAVCFTAKTTFRVKAAKPQALLHILSIPYYSTKGDWDSVLTLNNSAHEPLTASLTLYSLDGRPLQLPDVSLQEHESVRLRLSELVAQSTAIKGQFQEGSIELRFNNNDGMALAPQLTVSDRNHGLSFDMEPPMGFKYIVK